MWRERICFGCEHFCLNNDDGLRSGCRAFPDVKGIPNWVGNKNSHDKVVKGQVGDYVYMPAKRKIDILGRIIKVYQ